MRDLDVILPLMSAHCELGKHVKKWAPLHQIVEQWRDNDEHYYNQPDGRQNDGRQTHPGRVCPVRADHWRRRPTWSARGQALEGAHAGEQVVAGASCAAAQRRGGSVGEGRGPERSGRREVGGRGGRGQAGHRLGAEAAGAHRAHARRLRLLSGRGRPTGQSGSGSGRGAHLAHRSALGRLTVCGGRAGLAVVALVLPLGLAARPAATLALGRLKVRPRLLAVSGAQIGVRAEVLALLPAGGGAPLLGRGALVVAGLRGVAAVEEPLGVGGTLPELWLGEVTSGARATVQRVGLAVRVAVGVGLAVGRPPTGRRAQGGRGVWLVAGVLLLLMLRLLRMILMLVAHTQRVVRDGVRAGRVGAVADERRPLEHLLLEARALNCVRAQRQGGVAEQCALPRGGLRGRAGGREGRGGRDVEVVVGGEARGRRLGRLARIGGRRLGPECHESARVVQLGRGALQRQQVSGGLGGVPVGVLVGVVVGGRWRVLVELLLLVESRRVLPVGEVAVVVLVAVMTVVVARLRLLWVQVQLVGELAGRQSGEQRLLQLAAGRVLLLETVARTRTAAVHVLRPAALITVGLELLVVALQQQESLLLLLLGEDCCRVAELLVGATLLVGPHFAGQFRSRMCTGPQRGVVLAGTRFAAVGGHLLLTVVGRGVLLAGRTGRRTGPQTGRLAVGPFRGVRHLLLLLLLLLLLGLQVRLRVRLLRLCLRLCVGRPIRARRLHCGRRERDPARRHRAHATGRLLAPLRA